MISGTEMYLSGYISGIRYAIGVLNAGIDRARNHPAYDGNDEDDVIIVLMNGIKEIYDNEIKELHHGS